MSSLINKKLWASEFNTPMPEGMTYSVFHAIANRKQLVDNIDDTASFIKSLRSLPDSFAKVKFIQLETEKLAEMRKKI